MALILYLVLTIATFTDIRDRRIPNWVTYPALLISLYRFDYWYLLYTAIALLGALTLGKEIGMGDFKLGLVIAIYSHMLDWSQIWIYLAFIFGAIFALIRRSKSLPFAPFMALGVLSISLINVAQGNGFI